jgi:hypothetical protein
LENCCAARNEGTAARLAVRAGIFATRTDGVAVALVIYLSLCCAVAAFFALVVYYLMQPTRFLPPNPRREVSIHTQASPVSGTQYGSKSNPYSPNL